MLKQQIIEHRLAHRETRTLLGVVLGEFERVEMDAKRPQGPITDAEAIGVIKKLIASNIECNTGSDENIILEQFLPQQLNELDIKNILEYYKFNSVGECMKHFKEFHTGLYDGKQVSKLYSQIK